MPVSLTMKNVRYDTYSVSGKTLADIAKSIKSKGPKDPNDNKKVTFLTTTELECLTAKGKYVADGKPKIDKKTGWYEVTAKISTLKLVLHPSVRCPKRSVSGLSTMAVVEWYRFYAACLVHEAEHVDRAKKECAKIAKEQERLRGKGLAETEAEALKQAQEDLMRAINIHIFDDRDRLNALHRKIDHASHHGEKKGALLDVTVT